MCDIEEVVTSVWRPGAAQGPSVHDVFDDIHFCVADGNGMYGIRRVMEHLAMPDSVRATEIGQGAARGRTQTSEPS